MENKMKNKVSLKLLEMLFDDNDDNINVADCKTDHIFSPFIGRKVIIRDHMAGVFCTTLLKLDGEKWIGGESRKIHYWSKAGAVEGISKFGIDLEKSRITAKKEMSCGGSIVQICHCDDEIYEKIMGAPEWKL